MKIKVLIVEDEWIVSEEIKEVLVLHGFEVVGQTDNSEDALAMAEQHTPDIALLDIHIQGQNDGIETAKLLSEKYKNIAIIYLTAFADSSHLDRAKRTKPAAYMIKPFEPRNLAISIDLAFSNLQQSTPTPTAKKDQVIALDDRIFIKENHKYIKLLISEILYVEAFGSYCEVTTTEDKHTFSFNLKQFQEKINHSTIYRVHRSFIINLEKVDAINGNMVMIQDRNIPIGESYRKAFAGKFNMI